MRLPHPPVALLVTAQGQLEGLAGPPRQVEELQELVVLAPVVDLAVEDHLPPRLLPVADGGERLAAALAALAFPEVQHDRLPRGLEIEAGGDRQAAVGSAVVFAEGEEG